MTIKKQNAIGGDNGMIRCDTCPYCYDAYPGKLDSFGNHFHICGMGGNMVYTKPRKEKRYSGTGYIHFEISTCGLFESVEAVLARMTEIERQRYYERMEAVKRNA